MGDKHNTSPQGTKRPAQAGAPSAKLAARRVRQAAALRENLAKRKRQGQDGEMSTSGQDNGGGNG